MSLKGKEIAEKSPIGRKRKFGDSDKNGGRSKKERGVIKFFEDSTEFDDYEDRDNGDIDNCMVLCFSFVIASFLLYFFIFSFCVCNRASLLRI